MSFAHSREESVVVHLKANKLLRITYDLTLSLDGFFRIKKLEPKEQVVSHHEQTTGATNVVPTENIPEGGMVLKENSIVKLIESGREKDIDKIISLLNTYFSFNAGNGFALYFGASDLEAKIDLRTMYDASEQATFEQKINDLFSLDANSNVQAQSSQKAPFSCARRDFDGRRHYLIIKSIDKEALEKFISLQPSPQQAFCQTLPLLHEALELLQTHLPLHDVFKRSLHLNQHTTEIESEFFLGPIPPAYSNINIMGAHCFYRRKHETKTVVLNEHEYTTTSHSESVLKFQLVIKICDFAVFKDNLVKKEVTTLQKSEILPAKEEADQKEMKNFIDVISKNEHFFSGNREQVEFKLINATYGSFFIRLNPQKNGIILSMKQRTPALDLRWMDARHESQVVHSILEGEILNEFLNHPNQFIIDLQEKSKQAKEDFKPAFEKIKITYSYTRSQFKANELRYPELYDIMLTFAREHSVPYANMLENILTIAKRFNMTHADAAKVFKLTYEDIKIFLKNIYDEYYANRVLNSAVFFAIPYVLGMDDHKTSPTVKEGEGQCYVIWPELTKSLIREASRESDIEKLSYYFKSAPELFSGLVGHVPLLASQITKFATINKVDAKNLINNSSVMFPKPQQTTNDLLPTTYNDVSTYAPK